MWIEKFHFVRTYLTQTWIITDLQKLQHQYQERKSLKKHWNILDQTTYLFYAFYNDHSKCSWPIEEEQSKTVKNFIFCNMGLLAVIHEKSELLHLESSIY